MDIWFDVDSALAEVPINMMPLLDDTDFKTREVALTYNQAGLDLVWNFITTAGAMTQTAVTPTDTAGAYDWVHQGDGMYTIEIPASGGASINNDTEGFGWFTGMATGVLPWRSPIFGFRAAAINNDLIDAGTALAKEATLTTIDGIVDDILVDTGTTLDTLVKDIPTNTEFEARTLVAASYFDPAADTVATVTTTGTATNVTNAVKISAGTGAGQLDFTSGVVKANLAQILGTALTETAGLIAAGFKKFFNVATPTGTVNSLPDAIPTAANGIVTGGTGTSQLSVSSGKVLLQATQTGVTIPTVTTTGTATNVTDAVKISAGTAAGQLDFTSGVVKVNLVQILGSAITGTAAQIVAAFTKFFDKASPTGTVNSLPDAVAGANGGLPTTNGTKVSQTVDLTAGQSIAANGGTVTTLTNLPAITANWLTAAGIDTTAITEIQAGLALEATLTAIKGAGWTTETLAAIDVLIDAIKAKTDTIAAAPTAAAIADAVLDEAISGHVAAGSFSKAVIDILEDTGTTIPGTITTVDNEIAVIDGIVDDILLDTGTTIPATLDTIDNFLDTEVAAILEDTGTTLPAAIAAVKAETALIVEDTGTTIPATITTIDNEVGVIDGIVDTILADTNELQTDWVNGGRLDLLLDAAGSAGDPWTTALPGAYGAGTAGKIIGDNINAPIETIDTVVDAIKTKTDNLPADPADDSDIDTAIAAVKSVVDSILADTGTDGVIVASGTVTTLTNLPAITADWLTAAGVKADAVTKIQNGLSKPATAQTITAPADMALNSTVAKDATVSKPGTAQTITMPTIPNDWLTAAGVKADAVTKIQANLALEATLTAMKGAGWTTETLKALADAITNLDGDVADVFDDVGDVKTELDLVHAKTNNLPTDPADQSAVEAAITAGIATIPAGITAEDVMTAIVEGAVSLRDSLKLHNAALAGKASGGGTGTVVFRDLADTLDRIIATVDEDNNRTAVTRNLT